MPVFYFLKLAAGIVAGVVVTVAMVEVINKSSLKKKIKELVSQNKYGKKVKNIFAKITKIFKKENLGDIILGNIESGDIKPHKRDEFYEEMNESDSVEVELYDEEEKMVAKEHISGTVGSDIGLGDIIFI